MGSIFLAPNRGLLWAWFRRRRNQNRLQLETVLTNLYTLAQQHDDLTHGHAVEVLQAMSFQQGGIRHTLRTLAERNFVQELSSGQWGLTQSGIIEAERLLAEANVVSTELTIGQEMPA